MGKRVTIQDIADALGLSRNTVSKAINNSPVVAEDTKRMIFEKAALMGYKQFSYLNIANNIITSDSQPKKNEIALFANHVFNASHFGTSMIDKVQCELGKLGYGLTIYRVMNEDIAALRLPATFDSSRAAGILCMELFNYEYCSMLCDLSIPLLSVDAPVTLSQPPVKMDVLLMENYYGTHAIVRHMKDKGVRSMGFIGDIMHCRSFCERASAFHDAVYFNKLPYDPAMSFIESINDGTAWLSALERWFDSLESFPEFLMCANDSIALAVIKLLKKRGLRIPEDILIAGFDDSPESRYISPPLTTVHIHSQSMGLTAVEMLISRIKAPDISFRTTYSETDVILRASTKD